MPVLHFGMTGMLQVKGEMPVHYREAPRKTSDDWPPRFMKFILHIHSSSSAPETEAVQIAFLDARRLGRVRLCQTPLTEPPISNMGFDPIISMPSLEDFRRVVLKRTCPIKALLLDQSFSAGVGNWVADEILYHARVHPEQRCNTLSDEQTAALHHQTEAVCRFAVEVNADDSKFPEDWLFKHRWGKGKLKKGAQKTQLKLPSGEAATIRWITVGGRTSAYVLELQSLPKLIAVQNAGKEAIGRNSHGSVRITESDPEPVEKIVRRSSRKVGRSQPKSESAPRKKAARQLSPIASAPTRKRRRTAQ